MSKGKSVWLDQEVLNWLNSLGVGDESYTSILKRVKVKFERLKEAT